MLKVIPVSLSTKVRRDEEKLLRAILSNLTKVLVDKVFVQIQQRRTFDEETPPTPS